MEAGAAYSINADGVLSARAFGSPALHRRDSSIAFVAKFAKSSNLVLRPDLMEVPVELVGRYLFNLFVE